MTVNTSIVNTGWRMAQASPSTVCLYRTLMSRQHQERQQLARIPELAPVDGDPAWTGTDDCFGAGARVVAS